MSQSTAPRRRFVPVPIETTFESVRKVGPTAELTPDPSPQSASPPCQYPLKGKRRFAPQLIESSRRSRRSGDVGPATKPTDKTDITPHTNHIYAPKTRRRHNKVQSQARRESCDDEIAGHVFDLVARDAERKLEEVAMSAFPNSEARTGGAEHFFVREGSDDDDSSGSGSSSRRGRTKIRPPGARHSRRDSSEEDVGWALREMQQHHEQLAKTREDRISTLDLDRMSIESPPGDALWTTNRKTSEDSIRPIGETLMPYIPEEPLPPITETHTRASSGSDSPQIRPIGEIQMPYIPSAPPGQSADMPYIAPVSRTAIPPETGFRSKAAFGSPFGGGYRNRDFATERELHRLRNTSPPMLGKDLTFRKCPSPQQTKLEPDHLWIHGGREEENRDHTEQHGLWRGYCYDPEMKNALAAIDRPLMISTPHPLLHPGDPFSSAFGSASAVGLTREPSRVSSLTHSAPGSTSEHRPRNGQPKGLHMLMGLEERLKKEKASADLEDQIHTEFTDGFVTQVYNYLSLGYPAMARNYDEELCKISRISMDELQKDDDDIMDGIGNAKGHINLTVTDESGEERCPRWRALRLYIFEWARQHPDLQSISPLTWGVRERRGSWGI